MSLSLESLVGGKELMNYWMDESLKTVDGWIIVGLSE